MDEMRYSWVHLSVSWNDACGYHGDTHTHCLWPQWKALWQEKKGLLGQYEERIMNREHGNIKKKGKVKLLLVNKSVSCSRKQREKEKKKGFSAHVREMLAYPEEKCRRGKDYSHSRSYMCWSFTISILNLKSFQQIFQLWSFKSTRTSMSTSPWKKKNTASLLGAGSCISRHFLCVHWDDQLEPEVTDGIWYVGLILFFPSFTTYFCFKFTCNSLTLISLILWLNFVWTEPECDWLWNLD